MRGNKRNDKTALVHKDEFELVYHIISMHRNKVVQVVNNESLNMMWEIGGFISHQIKTANWGDGIVRQLAEFIHTQDPTARGWSYRTIYKMAQFYDTYTTESFSMLLSQADLSSFKEIVPFQTAQNQNNVIVPFQTAQNQNNVIVPFKMAQIPNILFSTGWTNHQIILNRCSSDQERLFYILYASRERLQNKELTRAIKTNVMNSILGGAGRQSNTMVKTYPTSPMLFKERIYLDMLGLPLSYKETKLRKEIVSHMKDFILEMGKDFLFIDEEHRVNVGGKTFRVDLLFYHRLLQCMVAIELKASEFHPKDLGQLEFYLEALDQEERRSNENPSIGIILCKEADQEVVRYALNRSMSPTMVTQYKEQLQVGSVLQRSLVEFCKFLSNEAKSTD